MTDAMERLRSALADRYRIERELGQGGMATVYLAADLKHDRRVALKVLHPELAAVIGAERFLAEIRVTANLQHPNIVGLFDSGSADGLVYYVMPFVDGESLRARLTRERQLPVEDTVRIGQAVAGALSYAHRHGVIHRDIKPENILLQDNQPMVADFGIALAVREAGGARLTQTGLSLGTPQYMSPEQAGGDRDLDARTDIYSLGAVLYECLAGEAPFSATSTQAIIARLMSEDPRPLSSVRRTVPAGVEAAVHKALAKLPADRFPGAGSFSDALVAGLTSGEIRPTTAVRRAAPRRATMAAIAAGTLVAGAALGYLGGTARAPGLATYDLGLPDSAPIAFAKGGQWGEGWRALALSPTADAFYYIADRDSTTELWQRSLTDATARPVAGTTGVSQFYVSPDGKSVAVFARALGRVVSLTDQSVTELGEFVRLTGAVWVTNTRLAMAELEGGRLVSVDLLSGARDTTRSGASCYLPKVLEPDGKQFLCPGVSGSTGRQVVHTVGGGAPEELASPTGPIQGSDPHWVDGKYLVWLSPQGDLMAAKWGGPGSKVGTPVRVLTGLRSESVTGVGQFSVARGILAYAPGETSAVGHLVVFKETGGLDTLRLPARGIKQFDFSRDGRRMAATVVGADGDELWGYDLVTGRGERWLTASGLDEPRWSPDGRRLMVRSQGRAGGPGRTLVLTPGSVTAPDTLPGDGFYPSQWFSEDLAFGHLPTKGDLTLDLVAVHLGAEGVRVDTLRMPGDQSRAMLSPDGRWLAFMAGNDVVLEDYPVRTRRITVGPGLDPLWTSRDELAYREGNRWHWVRVNLATGETTPSRPTRTDPDFVDTPLRSQALMADGRVAYVQGTGRVKGAYVRVVPDWLAEVRKALAGRS